MKSEIEGLPGQILDRRVVLKGIAGAAAAVVSAKVAQAQDATAKEAPSLARDVADGKLPKLADRLPESPMVVQPLEQVGTYGGVWRRGLRGSNDHNGMLRCVGNMGLVRWSLDFTEVLPNVAERWDVSSDASELVFYLRKGMKWSDGTPFTADDVVFSVEDCAKNSELYPSTPTRLMAGGKPVEVTKIDDFTVKFKFAVPNAIFLELLATPLGQHPTLFQKAYASKFHPKYNPDVNALLASENAANWPDLFRAKNGDIELPTRWGNPEKPTLDPWLVVEPYVGGATRVIMRRNPYFWQVDTDGKQLPYIDEVNFGISQDVESLMLDVISGKLDMQERHIGSMQNMPILSQNQEKGGYRLVKLVPDSSQQCQIYLNLTHKDPAMRAMLGDKEFRKALSLGINREEIIDLVFLGQSEPWQTGPRPTHPWYHEQLGRQFTDYDPDQANAILDKIGYDKRDGSGMRLRPDGAKVFITIDVLPTLAPELPDVLELIKRQWVDIGVDVKVNTIERALFFNRSEQNAHDAQVWVGGGGLDPMLTPWDWFAQHVQGSRFGVPWAQWFSSDGKEGEEPPESQKQRMRLYEEARSTIDIQKRGEIMKQFFDICADSFETVGVCLAVSGAGIAKVTMVNVPQTEPDSWSYPNPAPSLPQQYFYKS